VRSHSLNGLELPEISWKSVLKRKYHDFGTGFAHLSCYDISVDVQRSLWVADQAVSRFDPHDECYGDFATTQVETLKREAYGTAHFIAIG